MKGKERVYEHEKRVAVEAALEAAQVCVADSEATLGHRDAGSVL